MSAAIERAGRRRQPSAASAARLLTATAAGDRSAFGELVDDIGALFCASISTVTSDAAVRDRVCVEAFTAVWRRADEGARSSEPMLWLLEVLCETLGSARGLARPALGGAILSLDCPDRELLLLALAGGRSQAEIADLTGVAESRVRRMLCAALATLRSNAEQDRLSA